VTDQPGPVCPSTISDGQETMQCLLPEGHEDGDHRHGFLAWDNDGHWYARRDFPDLYPAIGTLLREAREQRGLIQIQVAKAVGLTRSSIANIERGTQRLPLHNWVGLCQTLGVDPADVITRALQGSGPRAEPLPAQEDKRVVQLRRHLQAVRDGATALLDSMEQQ
jgi:transcriptional regulator with XRE-family HTH domain